MTTHQTEDSIYGPYRRKLLDRDTLYDTQSSPVGLSDIIPPSQTKTSIKIPTTKTNHASTKTSTKDPMIIKGV